MTLQRVERVELQDWRNWQGPLTLENLPSGLVVLAGPNALGKTGVWEAIVAALLDRHWGKHTERLRPAGTKGVLPRVCVDFFASDRRLRVEKHFGSKSMDRAELHEFVDGKWALRDKGEEAYKLCRRAALGKDESAPNRGGPDKALGGTLMEVLLAAQGRLAEEAPAPGAVSIAVTDRQAADTATQIGRLLSEVRRQCDEFWVGKRERLKKGCNLANLKDELRQVEDRIPVLRDEAEGIDALVKRLDEAAELGEDREVAEAQNEEALGLREVVKAHRESREVARRAEEDARREREAAEGLLADRLAFRKKVGEAAHAVEAAQVREKEAALLLRQLETEQRRGSERRDRLAQDVARHKEWIAHEERGGRLAHLRERLNGIRTRLADADEAEKKIGDLEAELKSLLLPTTEEWAEWDDIQERWARAEGAVKAGAWSVSGRVPAGLSLTVDGESVDGDAVETEATREAVLADDDGAALHLEAPRGNAERLEAVTVEAGGFLKRFDVADITALRKRNEYVLADLERQLALARQRHAVALGDDTRMDLMRDDVEISGLIDRDEAGSTPGSERPEGHPDLWRVRLESLETDLADARENVESGGEKLGSAKEQHAIAESAVKATREDREVAKSAMAEHRQAYGEDDAIRDGARQWEAKHEALREKWQTLEDARPMAEDAKEKKAERLSAGLGEILRKQRKVQQIEADIEARRREDPAGKLAAADAQRAALIPRIREEETKANALRLLECALGDEKERVTHAIGQPVRDRVQKWVDYLLHDGSRVVVDEHGRPVVIRTPADREVPLPDQSFGTREQLSVLYRLAVADLVAVEAGSGVCLMLDDPFGHSDRHRRGRMLEILDAEAEKRGHQVLLFTCRPEDFAGVGHHVTLTEPSTPSP